MKLDVWLAGRRAGTLSYTPLEHRFSFQYTPEWLAYPRAYALGPTLPLMAEPPADAAYSAAVRQFFENLLPEGQALDDAARTHKLSKGNLMGLLAALGGETAGALQLRLPNTSVRTEEAMRRPLPLEELSARIQARPHIPFSVWDGRVRLSIAGFQDKIAVQECAGQWLLVEGANLASTHILKPEPVAALLAGLTSNEFFCMRLARAVGLQVADVELVHVPEPVLAITRFDRKAHGPHVERRHIIDGCQALGLSSALKYERPYGDTRDVRELREGASLPMLFELLNASARPAAERLALLRWTIFQVLIGNTDAHAKNLSFYVRPEGLSLAPAYDLVCATAFEEDKLSNTFAMAIGDAFLADDLSAFEWANFAQACGLQPRQVSKELDKLSRKVRDALAWTSEQVLREGVLPPLAERLQQVIGAECERQARLAPEVARVSSDLL